MKANDTTKNKTANSITKLNNPYISVEGSFGGNQGWFETLDNKKKAETLMDFGCGLIGVGDILLYITGGGLSAKESTELDKKAYHDYILSIEKRYFHVLPKMGISGPLLAWGMNLYFFFHKKEMKKYSGNKYHARWFVRPKNLLSKIKEMLSNDIPVLFSVGPGFFHKEKLPLYSKNVEGTKLVFKPVQRTKDHYMIITGVLEGEKTMLEISSWGKRFYISYEEYIKYIKKYDNYFFSNILYIKKKGTKKK